MFLHSHSCSHTFKGVFEGSDLVLTFRGLVVIDLGLGAREWIRSMKVPTEIELQERKRERACVSGCARAHVVVYVHTCACVCVN